MRNFVILFEGREGTTSLVQLLAQFRQVAIVRQVNDIGWEPFDRLSVGAMPFTSLKWCLNRLLAKQPIDLDAVNRVYMRTAKQPLVSIPNGVALGWKMRFRQPDCNVIFRWPGIRRIGQSLYASQMIRLLRRKRTVVFVAVRQDVMRWALSNYHGDGNCNHGHIQFKLAAGHISRSDMDTIHVDCERLEGMVESYEAVHRRKLQLVRALRRAGVTTHILKYEDYVADRPQCVRKLLANIEVDVTEDEMSDVLRRRMAMQKVHSDDISTFVKNHEEVYERFAHRFIAWQD